MEATGPRGLGPDRVRDDGVRDEAGVEPDAPGAPGTTVLGRVAGGLDRGGLRRALVPVLAAAGAATLAGAALAGGLYLPQAAQLAALGPAAALAAPVVALAALLLLHRQSRDDAEAAADRCRMLAARGANPAQLVLLSAGPRALLALLAGAMLPLVLVPILGALPLHAAGRGAGALLGPAWVWSACTGAAMAAAAVWGAAGPSLRSSARDHVRQVPGWRRPAWWRWYIDLILMAGWGALGAAGASQARNAASAAASAAISGPAFNTGGLSLPPVNVPTPHFALAPLVYLAPAGFALGAALLGARLAAMASARLERRGRTPAAALLLLRDVARGRGWTFLLVPALAAAAFVFAATGGGAVGATALSQRQMSAGSDLRVEETWPAPCSGFCTEAVLQALPLPDITQVNHGLPGVASDTALVPAQDQITTGATGTTPATLIGVDPAGYAATVRWPAGYAGTGRRVLALLTAHPGSAVISQALAEATGLGPGQQMQSQLMGVVPVAAVVPSWPGLPAAVGPWALVGWRALQPALQQHGAYTGSGFSLYELFRLAAGGRSGPVVAALRQQSLTVAAIRGGGGGGGGAAVARVLWPLALLAALVGLAGLRLPWRDRGALPEEAAAALGASEISQRLGVVGPVALAGWGLAAGALAGWGASALFWPDLQMAAGPVAGPILVPALGGWAALLAAALVVWRLRGAVGALAAAPDPLVIDRVEAALAAAPPEPAAPGPEPSADGASRPAAARARSDPAAARIRSAFTVLRLAARRLRASATRVVGLALGLLLASAVAATVPIYTAGSLTRVLHAGLQPYNDRPAGAVLVRWLPNSQFGVPGGSSLSRKDAARLQAVAAGVGPAVGLPTTPLVRYAATQDQQVITAAQAANPYATGVYFGGTSIDMLTGLSSHIQVVQGRMYRPGTAGRGPIDAMVTEDAFRTDHLQVGQVYLYPSNVPGTYVRLRLVGVFQQIDPTGPYWPYRYYTSDFFIEPSRFAALESSGQIQLGEAAWYTTLDLSRLTAEQVPQVITGVQRVALAVGGVVSGARMDVSPYAELAAFLQREQTLTGLLRLVSIPILAIALYFVAITAGLIVSADAAEISVFASRGAGVVQILALYLLEWVLLALPVAVLGPFPAALFSRGVGASQGFLRFASGHALPVFIRPIDFAYSGVAAALGVVAAMVPAVIGVGRTIVGARLRASRTVDQPLWQRAYLDGVALVLLIAIWWVFRNASLQGGGGAAALLGDPALFVLPPVFLVVAGLLVVRFLGWLLRTLDVAVGPFASPSLSLPLRRIGRLPAQFAPVLLLLCFTAALGTYSAASARTLDQNLTAAADYQVGAQAQLQEVSPCSVMKPEVGVCLTYDNHPLGPQGVRPMPPFSLHKGIPGVEQAAELVEEQVTVQGSGTGSGQADLVLVNPTQYAQVAWWMNGLNPQPLWHYVDQLLAQPDAALVDPGLAASAGLQVGQTFTLSDGVYNGTFTDVGTVQRWSGSDANAPLVVANLAYAKSSMGMIPAYRTALLRLAPHASVAAIESALGSRGIFTQSTAVASQQAAQALSTPEWAGQTGMLTVGFLTALGITILGYLLYAAVLLRGQLSQLGLLFALGLPWGAVLSTVAVEQGALLLSGAAGGALAGLVAAALFLPLFRPAFTGPGAPPFLALGPGSALSQVALVLAVLLVIALGTLLLFLRRMHVGETIKLEE